MSDESYAEQVEKTKLFLAGKSQELMGRLADEMESASTDLRFEEAAERRDQLMQLQKVQSVQGIEGVRGNLDVLAVSVAGGSACVQVLFIREARSMYRDI